MADGDRTRFGKWLLPPQRGGCRPRNMFLATASCLWGFLFAYGFAYYGIGFKDAYAIPGGIFLIISFLLSALYLHQYFRHRSMTYWGSGLAAILAVLPLHLSLSINDPNVCHKSMAKLMVLAFAFVGGPLLLYGLFHLVEHKARERNASGTSATTDVNVNDLMLSLLLLMAVRLTGNKEAQTGEADGTSQGIDKEELKNFALLLILFLSLYIFGQRFILRCWS